MQQNSNIIISDTSCLIILDKIDELELLGKMGKKEFGKILPNWILVASPENSHYQQILEMDLDEGEASAIALSLEMEGSILMLDELKGRRVAKKLNLRYSGTFGLILGAKQIGILDSVKPILEKIKSTNFRFNEKLFEKVLEQAGE